MVAVLAPAPHMFFDTRGANYQSDAQGYIANVAAGDFADLIAAGCVITAVRDNFLATGKPAATDDETKGYSPGSRWFDAATGVSYVCRSATEDAAVWLITGAGGFIARLIGANMNADTDQAIPLFVPAARAYRVTRITVCNASTSLTTAVGGVYNAASKAGTAIVASDQAYSALDGATKALDLTLAAQLRLAAASPLYLSLSTPQGAAATADVYVEGEVFY